MTEWVHTFTVGASRNYNHGTTGIGIVLQGRPMQDGKLGGRRGPIIEQLSELHQKVSPGMDGAFAIVRALEIALDRGYSRVRIRSDHNHERRKLRQQHRSQTTAADPVRARILDLARRFIWADFRYVPRRKNQLARRLARAALATEQQPPSCGAPRLEVGHRARRAGSTILDDVAEAEVFLEDEVDFDEDDGLNIPF
jgi:ribonuclease HI